MSSVEIRLTRENDWWVAEDLDTGVASQGKTREAALENLDEAVALHRGEAGEPIESPEEEHAALEELGLAPDEIAEARDRNDTLPEFMQ
jgi:predicted RNase H-like HicB family nuclease